ncbi:MAG: rod shape-determining protein MreC [Acidobacteriota bacterium]
MDSFLTRFKNPLVLLAIVLAQVLALAVQVQRPTRGFTANDGADGPRTTTLRHWIVAIVSPFERVSHASGQGVRHAWSNYIDLRHTREQNQELQQEITRLRLEQAEFAEDAAQGRRLENLLAFKQRYVAKTVAAQVIGTSGSDRSSMVTIDKGSADGLKPEQPVMTPDGVVGKLRDVFPHSAQLLLINDETSGAGVVLSTTRIRGILRGTANGLIQINNLLPDSRIKPGEPVLTSGGDQVFPRGLPVGVIQSVVLDPQHQPYTAITIKPAANLSRLEEVLVITETQATLPGPALADEDTAAAAEETKRAADVIAEKLPSVPQTPPVVQLAPGQTAAPTSSDTVPGLVGGVPGVPNSGLPRPKPAVRPDRYTPGTTPPANELTPGGAAPTTQGSQPRQEAAPQF